MFAWKKFCTETFPSNNFVIRIVSREIRKFLCILRRKIGVETLVNPTPYMVARVTYRWACRLSVCACNLVQRANRRYPVSPNILVFLHQNFYRVLISPVICPCISSMMSPALIAVRVQIFRFFFRLFRLFVSRFGKRVGSSSLMVSTV